MSKIAETDDRGRIVIPHEIREKHGDRYRVVEFKDRIELIPLEDDPIEGLRDAVGDAFDDKSIEEIKRESCGAAREDRRLYERYQSAESDEERHEIAL